MLFNSHNLVFNNKNYTIYPKGNNRAILKTNPGKTINNQINLGTLPSTAELINKEIIENLDVEFINYNKIRSVTQVIIRHLGREARAIRDLLITCLSIKDTDKKLAKIALKTITLQRADNRFPISFVTSL